MIGSLLSSRQRMIVVIAIIAMVIMFLSVPAVGNALFAFLFLGAIPGTDWQLPPWVMLLISIGLITMLLVWLSDQPHYIGNIPHQQQAAKKIARKKVAKSAKKQPAKRSSRASKVR